MEIRIVKSLIGNILVIVEGGFVTKVEFTKLLEDEKCLNDVGDPVEEQIADEAAQQLIQYFNGKRKTFTVPLNPKGTPYQQSVWNALQTIEYGQTVSYKEIAKRVGNEKASRSVGMANHNNPIAIMIPCHRVIGANGKLVGYAGGIDLKQWLINHEKKKHDETS